MILFICYRLILFCFFVSWADHRFRSMQNGRTELAFPKQFHVFPGFLLLNISDMQITSGLNPTAPGQGCGKPPFQILPLSRISLIELLGEPVRA